MIRLEAFIPGGDSEQFGSLPSRKNVSEAPLLESFWLAEFLTTRMGRYIYCCEKKLEAVTFIYLLTLRKLVLYVIIPAVYY